MSRTRTSERPAGGRLPPLVRFGLGLLVIGAAADIASHLLNGGIGISGMLGHGLTLSGMLVSLTGIVRVALRPEPRREKRGGKDARPNLAVG
jgi:hypothetical protein